MYVCVCVCVCVCVRNDDRAERKAERVEFEFFEIFFPPLSLCLSLSSSASPSLSLTEGISTAPGLFFLPPFSLSLSLSLSLCLCLSPSTLPPPSSLHPSSLSLLSLAVGRADLRRWRFPSSPVALGRRTLSAVEHIMVGGAVVRVQTAVGPARQHRRIDKELSQDLSHPQGSQVRGKRVGGREKEGEGGIYI